MGLYDVEIIPGEGSAYRQEIQVCGAPSVMPGHVWQHPYVHWSLPILAYGMRPLQPSDLTAYRAAWVPHSGGVDEPQAPSVPHRNSDIGYVQLKAPRF